MGRLRRSRTHSNPKKNQAPGQKTRRYKRDIDQIHDDMKDGGAEKMQMELRKKDIEDLPGMGQHGCIPCSKFFATPVALETHLTGKPHKRRCKILLEEPYTIEESRRAAGQGVDNGVGRPKVPKVELEQFNAAAAASTSKMEVVVELEEVVVPAPAPVAEGGLVGRLRGFAAMVGIKA